MNHTVAPLISVCVPVFDGERFIRDCIQSALDQTERRFELVVSDNCSTDGTVGIVASFDDPRIRYISNQANIGSIANFNKCIERARGDYFVLLPADDVLRPGYLKELLRAFRDHSMVGLAYSGFRIIDVRGRVIEEVVNHHEDKLLSWHETIDDIVEHFHPVQLAMARTGVLRNLGGFDSSFGPFCDIHLWARILFNGWSAAYVAQPLSCHRVHNSQGQQYFASCRIRRRTSGS